jgi:hypothetical protein
MLIRPIFSKSQICENECADAVAKQEGYFRVRVVKVNNFSEEQGQGLKYRTDTQRYSHMTGPATCPLCGGSDSAPHMLLRCNNHTLKRMHINRHHHAVSCCGEETSKGKLGSAIVTMDACDL